MTEDATLLLRSVGTPWLRSKVFWYVKPSYRGRVLIRGRRLDAPGTLRFGEQRLSRELRNPARADRPMGRAAGRQPRRPVRRAGARARLLRGPDGRHELLAHGGLPGHDGLAGERARGEHVLLEARRGLAAAGDEGLRHRGQLGVVEALDLARLELAHSVIVSLMSCRLLNSSSTTAAPRAVCSSRSAT